MASFTSVRSARPYIKYCMFVVYSYPNDDTEMATFDLTVLIFISRGPQLVKIAYEISKSLDFEIDFKISPRFQDF